MLRLQRAEMRSACAPVLKLVGARMTIAPRFVVIRSIAISSTLAKLSLGKLEIVIEHDTGVQETFKTALQGDRATIESGSKTYADEASLPLLNLSMSQICQIRSIGINYPSLQDEQATRQGADRRRTVSGSTRVSKS